MNVIELNQALSADYAINPEQAQFKFTDEYTAVEHEIQKLSSLYGEKPDYKLLIENALALLKKGNNDLLILNYLAFALLEQYRFQGFLAGVNLIAQRLTATWENLYPNKVKAKAASLNWLFERYQRFLTKQPPASLSINALQELLQALKQLDAKLSECFNNEINILALIRPFEEQERRLIEEQKSKEAQAQRAEEEARVQQEQELLSTLEQNREAVSIDEYLANMHASELHQIALKRVLNEHSDALKTNPLNFAIYKHHRAELWWSEALSFNEVLIRMDQHGFEWAPFSAALELKTRQDYLEALIAFENFFITYPYFLDTQQHIYECLEALGAEAPLLNMLKNEVQELCAFYPELADAKINNKIPILNHQAKTYLGLKKPI